MLKLAEYPILTAAYTKISPRVKKRNLSNFFFVENFLVTYSQVIKGWLVRGRARGCAASLPLLAHPSRFRDWMKAELSISIRQAVKQESEHDVLSVCL